MYKKLFRKFASLFLALAMIAIASGPQPARAAGPWYVATGGNDSNTCLSPGTACATINGALAKPGFIAGDTIRVAIGTYMGTGNEVVLLDKNVTLAGGWNASFTSQSGLSTINGQGARRGITISGTVTVVIGRFVVQNGSTEYGGGIENSFGDLTLNDSLINNNTAINSGGGIYHGFGILNLNNSSVSSNTGSGIYIYGDSNSGGTVTLNNSAVNANNGGGISSYGSLILNNSTINGNTGSGISAAGHDTTINNSTISNNIGYQEGGGLFSAGTVIINNSTISGNSAAYMGGGILSQGGTLSINNSTLSGNTTTSGIYGGGGIFNSGATVVFNESTINGNISGSDGGGINNDGGTLTLINTTVSGNSALYRGGGILNYSGIVSIYNGTLSENTTSVYEGGGLYNYGAYSALVTLRNTLLAGNTTSGIGSDCSGPISSSGFNLIGNTSNCNFASGNGDLINVDPLLGPLQDNGGPTFTHALLSGSPATNAGNPAGCTDQDDNLLTTDQRGIGRPQGTRCDIGAFELEASGGGDTEVSIDIKPGQFPNRIKLRRNVCRDNDNVYVAILTTPSFNARTVAVSSLQLGDPNLSGKASPIKSRITDVDRDGDRDMVLTFTLCSIVTNGAINLNSTEMVLTGMTLEGVNFTGRDSVKIVSNSYP